MEFKIIHSDKASRTGGCDKLMRLCLSNQLFSTALSECLNEQHTCLGNKVNVLAVPYKWNCDLYLRHRDIVRYNKDIAISDKHIKWIKKDRWFSIANGRFVARPNNQLLKDLLNNIQADVVFINADPSFNAGREKVKLTKQNQIAGFRRLYCDSTAPAPIPSDWPHQTLVRTALLEILFPDGKIPASFELLLKKCESNNLLLRSFDVAGTAFDLNTEHGLLQMLNNLRCSKRIHTYKGSVKMPDSDRVLPSARIFGKVLFGKDVKVGQGALILGPAIICDNASIETKSVINSSIVGPNVTVPSKCFLQNRVVVNGLKNSAKLHNTTAEQYHSSFVNPASPNSTLLRVPGTVQQFRSWSGLSYPALVKRSADIITALIVLVLFAPFLLFIAAAIKLTSRGPVFFKARRQGLHGKTFNCLKFRTMLFGADKIQDKLRTLSNVDGPQFKMKDDPRITTVGNFLRETYIDEIPQFFNVLFGQMSIVGPRPSPEPENTLCCSWRDARLSVRPGITGLWQICRTRSPNRDFQEWIFYDTKYVKDLSLKMDLWICWKTAKKLIKNFARQF